MKEYIETADLCQPNLSLVRADRGAIANMASKVQGVVSRGQNRCAEAYDMAPEDFLDEVLKPYCGLRNDRGAWLVFSGVYACAEDEFQVGDREPGWHRWSFPSADGITRISRIDHDAPWVTLSPSGAIRWGGKVAAKQRVSIAELLGRAGKHYSTTVGSAA